jgi:hypothetical protein
MKMMFFWVLVTFRRNILSPSSGLKMETVCSYETLVSTCKFTGPKMEAPFQGATTNMWIENPFKAQR